MSTPMSQDFGKATEAAREALIKVLGHENIEITLTETAAIPATGEQLFRVTAIVPGQPNAPRQVVVDTAGQVHDLAKLEATVGRRLFVPRVGTPGRLAMAPDRVTIDPTSNDLTLPN